ncbi:hypothetical protein [Polaribacter aestuariivivens]|uniref:hypothetical protein n=1 Tax=Polaribacter aestuariivivens TaxID=2304626 RepID=UPI003F495C86
MNTGIIMLFANNEKEIKENEFKKILDKYSVKFCFVNNASKDKTLEKLKEIKAKTVNNIVILDVKKKRGIMTAVKAGVRCLVNNEDFNSIIYFEYYKYRDFLKIENTFDLIKNKKTISSNRNLLVNVFSLEELAEIKLK